jgi:hypothetical protein
MRNIWLSVVVFLIAWPCFAQDNIPSKQEIGELVQKADEKVSSFEQAIQAAKSFLPQDEFKKDTDAAAIAHQIVRGINKNGPSAYSLVALVITLDDLVIDAGADTQNVLNNELKAVSTGRTLNVGALSTVIVLNNAAVACRDISELVGHATLRLVDAEEKLLSQAAK